jgi:DNA-directed RNA polymerase subunit beta
MQSLALDVNVVSEEGQRAEMRDEDDDLLRAAEELGIDLSGVRALAGEAKDEQLEGEDATDASGEEASGDEDAAEGAPDDEELVLPADEGIDLESLTSEQGGE